MKRTVLLLLCPLFVAALAVQALAADKAGQDEGLPKGARLAPVALVPDRDGLFLLGNYSASSGKSGYWIWRLNAAGDRLWQRAVPARSQEQLVAAAAAGPGAVMLAGVEFVHTPLVGFRSWLRRVSERGDVGAPLDVGEFGKATLLLRTPDSGWLVGGSGRRDPRQGMSDYDLWLVRLDGNGKTLWEKHVDRGSSESAVTGAALPDGSFALVSAVPRDPKTGIPALWLLSLDPLGQQQAEQLLPGARITSDAGSYLASTAAGLALLHSVSNRSVDSEGLDVNDDRSAGVRAGLFDSRWKRVSERVLTEFPAISTPALVSTDDGGFLLAGTFADGLRIEGFTPAWKPLWEKKVRQDGDGVIQFRVHAMAAAGPAVFVAGTVSSPVNAGFGQSVFLLRVNPARQTFDWVRMY